MAGVSAGGEENQKDFDIEMTKVSKSPALRIIVGVIFLIGVYSFIGGLLQAYYLYFAKTQPPRFIFIIPLQYDEYAGLVGHNPIQWNELQKSSSFASLSTFSHIVIGVLFLVISLEFFSGGKLGIIKKFYNKN